MPRQFAAEDVAIGFKAASLRDTELGSDLLAQGHSEHQIRKCVRVTSAAQRMELGKSDIRRKYFFAQYQRVAIFSERIL